MDNELQRGLNAMIEAYLELKRIKTTPIPFPVGAKTFLRSGSYASRVETTWFDIPQGIPVTYDDIATGRINPSPDRAIYDLTLDDVKDTEEFAKVDAKVYEARDRMRIPYCEEKNYKYVLKELTKRGLGWNDLVHIGLPVAVYVRIYGEELKSHRKND